MRFIWFVIQLVNGDGTVNFEDRRHQNVLILHYRNKICKQRIVFERVYSMGEFPEDVSVLIDMANQFITEVNIYINDTIK